MPTYEYACTVCAEQLEAVQRITDPPLTECPACGGALRKKFSPVGVVFKGSGFYKTDARSSSKPSAPAKPAAEGSSSSSSSSESAAPAAPSSDAKPASSTASDAKAS